MILAASLASLWKIINGQNVIMNHDLLFPTDVAQYFQLSLHPWNPLVNLGQPILQPDATFPLAFTYYLLNKVGLAPGEIERILMVGVIFLAGSSMYLLSMHLSARRRFVGLFSAFVYMFNPFVMDNILWGQVFSVNLAYSLIPLMLLCFILAMDRRALSFAGLTGVLLALMSEFDFQIAYIGFMILILWTLGTIYQGLVTKSDRRAVFYSASSLTLFAIAVAAASRLYLVLSVFLGHVVVGVGGPVEALAFGQEAIVYASENIGGLANTIRLTGHIYSFYQLLQYQALGTWAGKVAFMGTFLFASSALAAILIPGRSRNRATNWFMLLILLFAYLAAGTQSPGGLFWFLYQHVVGFFTFREPSKFSAGVALGLSYLAPVTLYEISRFLVGRRIRFNQLLSPLKLARAGTAVILVLLALSPSIMIFAQGNFGGLQPANFPQGYDDVYQWLRTRPGDFRVLILPLSGMGDWSDNGVLTLWTPTGYSDILFLNSPPKPIVVQPSAVSLTEGSRRVLYYLENLLYMGRVDELAPLLSLLGVKYIIVGPLYRPSPFDIFVQTPERAMELMRQAIGLTLRYSSGEFDVFENIQFTGIAYATNAPYLAFGDLDLFRLLARAGTVGKLPTLIYGYDLSTGDLHSVVALSKGVVLQDDRLIDYVMQSLADRYLIDVAPYVSQLEGDPAHSWVLGTVYPRPVSDVYASGEFYSSPSFIYTTGAHTSAVAKYTSFSDGDQQVWVRALQGPDAGSLRVTLGSHEFPVVSLRSQVYRGFEWYLVGSGKVGMGSNEMTLESIYGTNLVDRFVVVPTKIFDSTYENCTKSLEGKDIIFIFDPSSFDTTAGNLPGFSEPVRYSNGSIVISGYSSFDITPLIPLSSTFELFADVKVTSGHPRITIVVDGESFATMMCPANGADEGAFVKIGALQLSSGLHPISVEIIGNLQLYDLRLETAPLETSSNEPVLIETNSDSFAPAEVSALDFLPFVTFSTTYDQGWNMQATGGYVELHVETNGYANGWFIAEGVPSNKQPTLNLSFLPQTFFSVAQFTSIIIALTIAMLGISTLTIPARKKRTKHKHG